MERWKKLKSHQLFTSEWLNLRRDECQLPSGRTVDDYFVVEVPDGAAIVALTNARELILVRQYKHGLEDFVLELPAGIVEPNEEPVATISRELKEETGFVTTSIQYITTLVTKPALMLAKTHVYFADGAVLKEEPKTNDSEVIEVVLVPLSELTKLIAQRRITTETSLAALLIVWDRLFDH